ncbi:hypothetical protein J4443_03950 [Candidatus Woesearchaeota archaeon]|nr:hypothetical protein [Candidatus Woesearchaeota archaeon]
MSITANAEYSEDKITMAINLICINTIMKNKKQDMEKLKMIIRKIHGNPRLMKIAKKYVAHLGSSA